MRFNFSDNAAGAGSSTPSSPVEDLEWVPLQDHPALSSEGTGGDSAAASSSRSHTNLLAWDGASRLYFWERRRQFLHRITIRLGDPDPMSVLAASPSKVLRADMQLNSVVNKALVNRNGSAVLLVGSTVVHVMYLYGRSSAKGNATICRTASVGLPIYSDHKNAIRILQVSWHPYSNTHLGILSSDSVLRIFDLSSALQQPEQEYYLQPVERGRSRNAASICPVDFSFGSDHLWDRFSIFVLFSDGSIYILCPVVPFGSVHRWDSLLEIYGDAQTFGLKSAISTAVSNSSLAICWLEGTFPELTQEATEEGKLTVLKAHPYALFDASVSLQGPVHKVCQEKEVQLNVQAEEHEGCAVSFLYNAVCKDSILVTAWSGGQLQVDALADEIQPLWNLGYPPRLCVDSYDLMLGFAMICESNSELPITKLDQSIEETAWLGYSPPLLRLAIVDLALPENIKADSFISMHIDPLTPERIYILHDGGIDSLVLHSLPCTIQSNGKDKTMKSPSVIPVLSTCQGESSSSSPLRGFVALSDSFGSSWIVGITSSQECIVVEMKTWNVLFPVRVDMEGTLNLDVPPEIDPPNIISKELLSGPKQVIVLSASQNLRSVAADSIEGRSTLHQYLKLFHENYVEYAHKVYFELKHHSSHVKRIIDDQNARVREAQQKLLKVEEKQVRLEDRVDDAIQRHGLLDERLLRLRKLPGAHKKPLSKAEREFKSLLERFTGAELRALQTSIEALNARLRRCTQSQQVGVVDQQRLISGRTKNYIRDAQISQLRSSVSKLSLVNSENSKRVKQIESILRNRESIS